MIELILVLLILLVCIITTFTDLKCGKIPNKVIGLFGLIGVFLVVWYYMRNTNLIYLYIINLAIVFVLGLGMFILKFWGAGDAKLWLLITFLFPYECYRRTEYDIFPSAYILVLVFSIAYIYVMGETIVKLSKKRNREVMSLNQFEKIDIRHLIYSLSIVYLYYKCSEFLFRQYYEQNEVLFVVIAIMMLNKIQNMRISSKNKIRFICCNIVFILIINVISKEKFSLNQLILSVCIVTVSNLVRSIASVFNYSVIPTKEVKKGMILSVGTVMGFQMSRVKGLPHTSDETTRSRITEDEAAAIRRWEKSKTGKGTIVVVEHLPFAIFFMLGVLLYIFI